ncbi:unnamed protein product [marine sediment metagenome]|uniref:Uncharacterized protein n=1 Tax=marine sediment metagenome TaxID=412755 RepID=X0XT86_9ZZZZ
MEDKKILKVIEPNPKPVRLFFFVMGIIATIAYRIIIVLNLYSPLWVKIAWYIGTIGFILYFGHRFNIAKKRANLVKDYKLIEAVGKADCIEPQKKLALHYLVETSLTSKSQWNSGMIFILSFAALLIGIFMDIYGV